MLLVKSQNRGWALGHHSGTHVLSVQLQVLSFLRVIRLWWGNVEITFRGANWKVGRVRMSLNQTLAEQLSRCSSAPRAQVPSTCKVGYLLGEAAAVLSQPGSFYRHVWCKVAFKWKQKGTAGEEEDGGYRDRARRIWELHCQLELWSSEH